MTTAYAGEPITLTAEFREYPGGPADDVTNLTFLITGSEGTVFGPTASVVHVAEGVYSYAWTPSDALVLGSYLAVWSADEGSASEDIVLATRIPAAPVGQVKYCTREDVKSALDAKQTARNNTQVDREVAAATGSVEGLCHRRFYPMQATRTFDWPDARMGTGDVIWFDESDLIEATSITLDGVEVPFENYTLEPANEGPPYTRIRLRLDGLVVVASTTPLVLAITGLWGYNADEERAGATVGELDDEALTVDVTDSQVIGVGSIIRIDSERLVVTGKRQLATGQTILADLAAKDSVNTVLVADGTIFAIDEAILVDGESMLIVDIAADTLIVKRAWDGSPLAAHTTGAAISAPRRLAVERGALGTSAATHSASSVVVKHRVPPLVRQLAIAEALTSLLQEGSGYGRVIGTGEGQREAAGKGLADVRKQVVTAHGRKLRRTVMP